jgi:hypothetical protein
MKAGRRPEEAEVTVLIDAPEEPVTVSDEELAIIDAGLAAARHPDRIDARNFLHALQLRIRARM